MTVVLWFFVLLKDFLGTKGTLRSIKRNDTNEYTNKTNETKFEVILKMNELNFVYLIIGAEKWNVIRAWKSIKIRLPKHREFLIPSCFCFGNQ